DDALPTRDRQGQRTVGTHSRRAARSFLRAADAGSAQRLRPAPIARGLARSHSTSAGTGLGDGGSGGRRLGRELPREAPADGRRVPRTRRLRPRLRGGNDAAAAGFEPVSRVAAVAALALVLAPAASALPVVRASFTPSDP